MASYKQETYCSACKRNVTTKGDSCPICGKIVSKGKWSARARIFCDGVVKEVKLYGFKTKRDAQEKITALLTESASAKRLYDSTRVLSEIDTLTFEEMFELFMAHKKTVYKTSSHYEFQQIGERMIIPVFGKKKVNEISKRDILVWQDELSAQGYSYDYKCKLRGFLNNFFKYAMLYYNLPANPIAFVPSFKRTAPKKEMHIWTQDQFQVFCSAIDDNKWKLFFSFAFFTGCRRGEIVSLNWTDINLDECTVKIHKNLTRKVKGKPYEIMSTPKTQSSNRTISIPINLARDLRTFKNSNNFADSDFVFAGAVPLHDNSINHNLKKYTRLANLPPIHMHEFRHSHASLLLAQPNITIIDVSKRLGHANVTETLNTYGHMLPNGNDQIIAFLDKNYPKF